MPSIRPLVHLTVLTLAILAVPPPAAADLADKLPAIFQKEAEARLPKSVKNGLGVYRRLGKMFKNRAECLAAGGTNEQCALNAVLCDLQSEAIKAYLKRGFGGLGRMGPTIAGQLGLFDAFKTSGCGDDCFWCCLTPTGCHTSFGPSPVINCNFNYGEGTHTLGRTLITNNPTGTDVCLAIPQTCDLYAECRIAGSDGYSAGLPLPPSPYEPPPALGYGYVTPRLSPSPPITTCSLDPTWVPRDGVRELTPRPDAPDDLLRAIADRKIRYIVESLGRKVMKVLDDMPPEHQPDELLDLLTLRGCVGHRHFVDNGEPYDGTHEAFDVPSIVDPVVREIVATRRALFFQAMLRVLGGVPNLYERLVFVESRMWTCDDRLAYLRGAGIEDPDAKLLETMSPLALAILKQVDGLQDYRLLAVPLAGEAPPALTYQACELGTAPEVTLGATSEGNEVVLQVSAVDAAGVGGVTELPVQIDWGDGTTSDGGLPVTSLTASFRHTYRAAGKYAVVAAVAGQSGLRGLTGTVIEAAGGDPAAPLPLGVEHVRFPDLHFFAATAGNAAPGTIAMRIDLVEDLGPERLGRIGDREIQVRKVETIDGVETVTNPGVTDLSDVIAYNPDRTIGSRIELRLFRRGGTTWDGRNLELRLRTMRLEPLSPQRGAPAPVDVTLTAAMVRVYYGNDLMMPAPPPTTEVDGSLRIPLVGPGGNGRTPLLDRVEIDLAPHLAAVDLGAPGLDSVPVGVTRRWAEVRPGVLVAGDVEGLPADGCGCRSGGSSTGGLLTMLVGLALVRRRRRASVGGA